MLKSQQLRIGNLIQEGWICAILQEEAIVSVESLDKPSNKMPYSILHGIPLTPEILRDCGFTYAPCRISGADMWQGMPFWSCDYFVLRGSLSTVGGRSLTLSGYYNTHYQFLHEIQNIYYSLVDEELNVEKIHLKTLENESRQLS